LQRIGRGSSSAQTVNDVLYLLHGCRSRLRGMHWGTLELQKGAMKHVGGSGAMCLEMRRELLKVKLCCLFAFLFISFVLQTVCCCIWLKQA